MGACLYCGHDHGNGLGSPRELKLFKAHAEEKIALKQEIADLRAALAAQPAQVGALPPLPRHQYCLNSSPVMQGYTESQMHAYARAAIASAPVGQEGAIRDAPLIEIGELVEIPDGFGEQPNTIFSQWNQRRFTLPAGTKIYALAASPTPTPTAEKPQEQSK
jgi:hypothetical protein